MTVPEEMPAGMESRLRAMGSEQLALVELMDKIQSAQLDDIKLPQIAVVGDQSAGKSSALEAITRIPFPRDAGPCTRFATEIRLRRSDIESVRVQIIPDKSRSSTTQARLRRFKDKIDPRTPFPELFKLAREEITANSTKFATRDKLVIERFGLNLPLLTLVDLPGLVKNANNEQKKEDIAAIEALTDRYMKAPQTVILAVIGGNNDYAHAGIMAKVRHYDPTGSRTIGVLTKPDEATRQGNEDRFLKLVRNEVNENQLNLGWFVLVNPDHQSHWPTQQIRAQEEAKFFSKGGWSTLTRAMCGSTALATKLAEQLRRHIAKSIPRLRKQVQLELDKCAQTKRDLGPGRDNIDEMRTDLVGWFNESKDTVRSAVTGDYVNEGGRDFFPRDVDPSGYIVENLRARVVNENEAFADHLRLKGHAEKFSSDSGLLGAPSSKKKQYAKSEVANRILQFRGTQLPRDRNHRIAYNLFESHSKNWKTMARDHMNKISDICNQFLGKVLEDTWPAHMRAALRQYYLTEKTNNIVEEGEAELARICKDLKYEVQPYDQDFENRLDQWMENRRAAVKDNGSDAGSALSASSPSPQQAYTNAELVLEQSLILYDIIAKTFIRNVIVQVIERHFMRGTLNIFDSKKAMKPGMPDEIVKKISAENEETIEKRIALRARTGELKEAIDKINSLPGQIDGPYDPDDAVDNGDDSGDEYATRGFTPPVMEEPSPSTHRAPRPATHQEAPYTPQPYVPADSYRQPPTSTQTSTMPGGWGGQDTSSQPSRAPQPASSTYQPNIPGPSLGPNLVPSIAPGGQPHHHQRNQSTTPQPRVGEYDPYTPYSPGAGSSQGAQQYGSSGLGNRSLPPLSRRGQS